MGEVVAFKNEIDDLQNESKVPFQSDFSILKTNIFTV